LHIFKQRADAGGSASAGTRAESGPGAVNDTSFYHDTMHTLKRHLRADADGGGGECGGAFAGTAGAGAGAVSDTSYCQDMVHTAKYAIRGQVQMEVQLQEQVRMQ